MNTAELRGKWDELKGKLKQKFATLTNNDLMYLHGKKDEMLGNFQIKLCKSKADFKKIISAL